MYDADSAYFLVVRYGNDWELYLTSFIKTRITWKRNAPYSYCYKSIVLRFHTVG